VFDITEEDQGPEAFGLAEIVMTKDELKAYIASHYADKMTLLDTGRHDPMYLVKAEDLKAVSLALRDDSNLKFDYLCNMGGLDTKTAFEVVYSIASVPNKLRLDFKLQMPYENAAVETLKEVWPAIIWYERELWELYGIDVKNHGNLGQFLLPDGWNQGFPMRKNWDAPDFIRLPEFGA
jgi:NADH-quinone oxidoreductase subunit C